MVFDYGTMARRQRRLGANEVLSTVAETARRRRRFNRRFNHSPSDVQDSGRRSSTASFLINSEPRSESAAEAVSVSGSVQTVACAASGTRCRLHARRVKIASPNLLNDQAVYPPAVPHGTVGSGIRASESGFRVRGGRRFPRSTGAHRRGIVFYRRAVEAAAVEAAAALADLGTRRVLAVSGSV